MIDLSAECSNIRLAAEIVNQLQSSFDTGRAVVLWNGTKVGFYVDDETSRSRRVQIPREYWMYVTVLGPKPKKGPK